MMCFGLGVGREVWEEAYLSSCKSYGIADIAAAAVFVMLDMKQGMRDSQESLPCIRSRVDDSAVPLMSTFASLMNACIQL